MARPGDIVTVNSRLGRWVVMELIGGPHGAPLARLVRRSGRAEHVGFVTALAGLQLLENPTFAPGDRVTVNGRPGVVVAEEGATVRVLLDPASKPLKGGGALALPAAECVAPRWLMSLENRT